MSKLWFKVPIILFCILIAALAVVFGKVAYAVSGMPEFGQILTAATNGLREYFKFLLDILVAVW